MLSENLFTTSRFCAAATAGVSAFLLPGRNGTDGLWRKIYGSLKMAVCFLENPFLVLSAHSGCLLYIVMQYPFTYLRAGVL